MQSLTPPENINTSIRPVQDGSFPTNRSSSSFVKEPAKNLESTFAISFAMIAPSPFKGECPFDFSHFPIEGATLTLAPSHSTKRPPICSVQVPQSMPERYTAIFAVPPPMSMFATVFLVLMEC
ncbi:Uncharacterised protein [Chlamydia trachomatis]|nr:Uncharacterised protein [Chlamydia trachomatis]